MKRTPSPFARPPTLEERQADDADRRRKHAQVDDDDAGAAHLERVAWRRRADVRIARSLAEVARG